MPAAAHSPWGGSGAHRWRPCPGSQSLILEVPEQPSGPHADLGTDAHQLAEMCLRDKVDAEAYLGTAMDKGNIVDREMADAVQLYLDDVRAQPGELFIEQKVSYTDWVKDGWGTLDALRFSEGLCIINDYKHGKGEKVFAKENDQGIIMALGVYQEFRFIYSFKRIVVKIHQPRLNHIDEWEFTVDDLLKWAEDYRAAQQDALSDNPTFNPGEKQCRWCRAKPICKAHATYVFEGAGVDYDFTKPPKLPEGKRLTPSQLAHALPFLKELKRWADEISSYAHDLHASGCHMPNMKMVKGGQRRRFWKDASQAEAVLKSMQIKQDEMYERKLISPAKADKLDLGKRRRARLDEQIGWTEGSTILVPESDPRPAVEDRVAKVDDFEEVKDETDFSFI